MKKSETFSPSAKAHRAEMGVVAQNVAEKKRDKNDSDDDDSDKNNKSKSIQTHVLLFLSQLNWMGMHIVFAVALRSSTRAMVLSFYREMLACVLLTMYCFYVRQRRKKRKRKEMTTDEMTTEVVVTATAEQANDDATKKTKDENGVTSMQIVAVSIVLGAILALIRGSVVLANANAGPDVTSALVLTTPVLTLEVGHTSSGMRASRRKWLNRPSSVSPPGVVVQSSTMRMPWPNRSAPQYCTAFQIERGP